MEYILLIALGYGVFKVCHKAHQSRSAAMQHRQRDAETQAITKQRQEQELRRRQAEHSRLNAIAGKMQLALLQLGQADDFRRAASWAAQAKSVPLAFRQRQFQRFRPLLVQNMVRCLDAGTDPELLVESLAQLCTNLGIAAFEAEYIRAEAQRRQPRVERRSEPNFGQQIQQLQQDHERRLESLQSLSGVEPEVREQLVEAEESRFRDALLQTDGEAPSL